MDIYVDCWWVLQCRPNLNDLCKSLFHPLLQRCFAGALLLCPPSHVMAQLPFFCVTLNLKWKFMDSLCYSTPLPPPVPLLSFVTNKDGRRTSFSKISFRTWKEDDPGSSLNLKGFAFTFNEDPERHGKDMCLWRLGRCVTDIFVLPQNTKITACVVHYVNIV